MIRLKFPTLVAAVLLSGAALAGPAETAETDEPPAPTACSLASFKPEVHTFYGDAKTVLEKLSTFQTNMASLRLYMLSIDGAGQSNFRMFERDTEDTSKMDVYAWEGGPTDELKQQIAATTLRNRGFACVGAQAKALVQKTLNPSKEGQIQVPSTAMKAFASAIEEYGNKYIRVTIYLMC
jgi:hypothetical protein